MEKDAENAIIAFAGMIKQRVDMPARLMSDGVSNDLFGQFAVVAQRTGVYTFRDYAEVLGHLIEYWGIAAITGLSGEAASCQDYLLRLARQYLAKADRVQETFLKIPKERFEWIFGRSV
jgi:acyl-[acyl-carrier-protein] desaturase